jgi:hypothetical protein
MSIKRIIQGLEYNANTKAWEDGVFPSVAEIVLTKDGGNVEAKLAAVPTQLETAKNTAIEDVRGGVAVQGDTLGKLYTAVKALQSLTQSEDLDLDTVAEIVAYIKEHETDLTAMGANKVDKADILNNLTTASTVEGKALDARQGKALKDLIDVNKSDISTLKTQANGFVTDDERAAALAQAVASGRIVISDTAPLSPVDGQIWFKPNGTATVAD